MVSVRSVNGGWRAANGGLLLFLLFFLGCAGADPVPRDTLLWRVDEWKAAGDSVRVATATILSFRSSGEYVELHARVIERPDATVYIVSDTPRITIVGTWEQDGETVTATRTRIKRPVPFKGPRDPFCDERPAFAVSGQSIIGNAGDSEPGTYSPVTRLVAPEFESYATEARERGATCISEP